MKKKIINIGLHPDVVNYSLFPGLTHEKLTQGLKAQEIGSSSRHLDEAQC